jgi:hypothetical protein
MWRSALSFYVCPCSKLVAQSGSLSGWCAQLKRAEAQTVLAGARESREGKLPL